MERIWSTELAAHVGGDVRLAGWLHHQRRLSQVTFLLLRDGAGIAQIVVESEGDRDRLAAIHRQRQVLRIARFRLEGILS